MKKLTLFIAAVLCICPANTIFAQPLSVSDFIIVHPGDSIQDAIDQALPGQTVLVQAGTYVENISLKDEVDVLGKPRATIEGLDDPAFNGYTVIGASAVLSGFIIESQTVPPRAIFANGADLTVDQNIIKGAIAISNGDYRVTNNVFNETLSAINQLYQSDGLSVIKNNLVLASNGFGLETSGQGTIQCENNTLVGNGTGIGIHLGFGNIIVKDTIIVDFSTGFSGSSNNSNLHTYNLLDNATNYGLYITPQEGEIIGDPWFTSGPGNFGNYHLGLRSPAIDAGDRLSFPYGSTNKQNSPDQARIDMGFHYTATTP